MAIYWYRKPAHPAGRRSMRMRLAILCLPLILLVADRKGTQGTEGAKRTPSEQAGFEFFEKKIRPVLVEHCYKCHSVEAKSPRGGLRLDSRDAIRKGGDTGPA